MRMIATAVIYSILITGLCAQQHASTDDPDRYAKQNPRAFRQLKISGEQVARNVDKLSKELLWHKTLGGSLRAARSQDKLVLWVQALGNLNGFL